MVPAAIRHFCCQDPQTVPYQTLHGLMGARLSMSYKMITLPILYWLPFKQLCKIRCSWCCQSSSRLGATFTTFRTRVEDARRQTEAETKEANS